jgi:hypothetical protein
VRVKDLRAARRVGVLRRGRRRAAPATSLRSPRR